MRRFFAAARGLNRRWLARRTPRGRRATLDPSVEVSRLGLSHGGLVVARDLQEYGAVCVDVGHGPALRRRS